MGWDVNLTQNGDSVFTAHTGPDWSIQVSGGGQWLASESIDRTKHLWSAESEKNIRTLTGLMDEAWTVAVGLDGRRVVSWSVD